MRFIFLLCLLFCFLPCQAQEDAHSNQDEGALLQAAQNPLADLMSFPFQNNTNFGLGPSDRTQNVLNIQPVIPFANGRLITRTIIPILTQPSFKDEGGSTTGLSDIQLTAFYAPPTEGLIWGFGPILTLPTATKSNLGFGKWSAGPAFVILVQPGPWTVGALVNNVWSFAGQKDRPAVNSMLINGFLVYNFPKFYVNYVPLITADWTKPKGEQWVVPLGAGIGKLFFLRGKLPVNTQAGAYYNVVTPTNGPDWQLRVQVQVLLPMSIFGGKK